MTLSPAEELEPLSEDRVHVLRQVGRHWASAVGDHRARCKALPVDPTLHRSGLQRGTRFQPVEWRNARTTLTWMVVPLVVTFTGLVALIHFDGIVPMPGEFVRSPMRHRWVSLSSGCTSARTTTKPSGSDGSGAPVVLPELVVRHRWHEILHSRAPQRLRRALRPLPGLVVTSVPVHITR